MAITIQYTDEGEEKIIGSDGKESEHIKIQWRQYAINDDVLNRIQRKPKVFTKSKISPETNTPEVEVENFIGSITNNGSSLFSISGDSALLSFTITDSSGENYTVDDSFITWYINGSEVSIKNNVYEVKEFDLIDREVNIIKAVYDDGDVNVSDDITILKYIGYDDINTGGDDDTDDPTLVGGVLQGHPNVDVVAPQGFKVGRQLKLYYKKSEKYIRWIINDGTGLKQGNGVTWIPRNSGIFTIEVLAFSSTFDFLDRDIHGDEITVKIIGSSESGNTGGSGNNNNGNTGSGGGNIGGGGDSGLNRSEIQII